jgi:hypothetical protein
VTEHCDYCGQRHEVQRITVATVHGDMTIKSCPRGPSDPSGWQLSPVQQASRAELAEMYPEPRRGK